MARTIPAIILTIACAAVASTALAQVYRWVDKDGKVHYSDKKPPDAPAKDMNIQSQPSDPDAAEKTLAELKAQNEGLDEKDTARKQAAEDQKRAAAQKAQQCENAQANLRLLETVNRSFTVDAKGNRTYDDDKQLEQRRADARRKVAESCG